nr:PTS system mannose/fructose/sorbose family transporter subunit IID [Firmicutes bacterium AM41-11]
MSEENRKSLTNKDLFRVWNRWYFSTELSNSYDRLQALSFCNAISTGLRKLYDDDEAYKEALIRHLEFYNSEGTIGGVIHGIVLSMEEENANSQSVPGLVITGIKTGLMGPLAGIGDTLVWGTIKPIIYAIGCTFAMQGNVLGGIIPFLFPIITYIVGWLFMKFGYTLGKDAVMKLMKNGTINTVITGASVLGLFMMGALSSSYVTVTTPLKFTLSNANPIVVQDILDSIVKGILPLCCVFGIYFAFTKKKVGYNKIIFGVLILSMIASFFGILG